MPALLLAGLVLGPLLVARVRHLKPAPSGVVVRPDAPKLDMAVVVDASPDDAVVKPLVATLTGQRPQPAYVVVEPGATAPAGVDMVVRIQPDTVLATPEALDRIAAALDTHPSIAVYPWVKTNERVHALKLFPTLLEALGAGAFSAVPLGPSEWMPTSLLAYKTSAATTAPTIYGGGHVVAQTMGERATGRRNPVATVLAGAYVAAAMAAAAALVINPSRNAFSLYAAYVLSLSICLKQVAKFPRASALIYPAVFVAGLGHDFMSAVAKPKLVAQTAP